MNKISLVNSDYINKLVRQNRHKLKSVLAPGAGMDAANLESDLNTVLSSLYLEDEEVEENINKLELLVNWHQTLSRDRLSNSIQLINLEKQIFWILGFKLIE